MASALVFLAWRSSPSSSRTTRSHGVRDVGPLPGVLRPRRRRRRRDPRVVVAPDRRCGRSSLAGSITCVHGAPPVPAPRHAAGDRPAGARARTSRPASSRRSTTRTSTPSSWCCSSRSRSRSRSRRSGAPALDRRCRARPRAGGRPRAHVHARQLARAGGGPRGDRPASSTPDGCGRSSRLGAVVPRRGARRRSDGSCPRSRSEGTAGFRLRLWSVTGQIIARASRASAWASAASCRRSRRPASRIPTSRPASSSTARTTATTRSRPRPASSGGAAFVWVVVSRARGWACSTRPGCATDRRAFLANAALTAGLIAFAINALTSNSFQHPRAAVFFWVVVGLQAGHRRGVLGARARAAA